jgi:hypothetical protein
LYAATLHSKCSTCPAHLILLAIIILHHLMKSTCYDAHYASPYSLLLFRAVRSKYSSPELLNTKSLYIKFSSSFTY